MISTIHAHTRKIARFVDSHTPHDIVFLDAILWLVSVDLEVATGAQEPARARLFHTGAHLDTPNLANLVGMAFLLQHSPLLATSTSAR